ncbi:MAG: hypothetical protein K6G26_08190 [Lachnospiraceae bacterium]|nr:hypothetical protein [Lachnospiraceae bacterium]
MSISSSCSYNVQNDDIKNRGNYVRNKTVTNNSDTDYMKIISDKKNEIYKKLKNGDTEQSFQIGGSTFTEREWNKLILKVDKTTEAMREAMREEHQKRLEEDMEEKLERQANNASSHIVYIKKDDMLYSGGNGTGLSFYLKYTNDSTEDNPHLLAKGIDEFGNEFEQIIEVKKVNPRNATLTEMKALEVYSGAEKRYGFSSLPMGSENVGLNQRQDFIAMFEKNIRDMNALGEYGIAQQYNKLLEFYERVWQK